MRTSVKPPEVRGDLRLLGVRTRHVTSSPRSSACADKERGRSGVGRLATCSRALGGHSGHLEDRLRAGAAGRAEHGDRALRSKRHPTLAQRGRRADAQRRSHREGARQEAEELHRSGEAISWQKRREMRGLGRPSFSHSATRVDDRQLPSYQASGIHDYYTFTRVALLLVGRGGSYSSSDRQRVPSCQA